MKLTSPTAARATISLVPLVDVMLILLIFFMVTSTYLNLDMVPVVDRAQSAAESEGTSGGGSTMLLRLSADGSVKFRGATFAGPALSELIEGRIEEAAQTAIVVLPSGAASMQSLVGLMELAARAGAENLRVMRLEARP